jgi:hypothetical protein
MPFVQRTMWRSRWPWILVGLILGSPVLIGGIIMTCYRIGMGRTAATLPDELAAARREGIPLGADESRENHNGPSATMPAAKGGGFNRSVHTQDPGI